MTISFQCKNCGQDYTIGDTTAGRRMECKKCGTAMEIPGGSAVPALPPDVDRAMAGGAGHDPAQTTSVNDPLIATPVIERVKRSLVYSNNATTDQIRADIKSLRSLDAEYESRESQSLKIAYAGAIGLAVGVGLGFLAFVAGTSAPGGIFYVLVVTAVIAGIAGAVAAIYGSVSKSNYARLNLENRRYEVLSGIVRLLAADTDAAGLMSPTIDFRKHNCAEKLIRKGKAGHWNVKYFVSRWFDLQGRLMDGTKYSLAMIDKHQDRHRTKRSASGKLKRKSKTKNAQEAVLKLKIKQKRYPLQEDVIKNARGAIKLPGYATVKSFSISGDTLSLIISIGRCTWGSRVSEDQQVRERVNLVAGMFLSLYQILNLSKAIEES